MIVELEIVCITAKPSYRKFNFTDFVQNYFHCKNIDILFLTSDGMEAERGQKPFSEGQKSMKEWIFLKKLK
jgi:hypothetical protein